MHSKTKTRRPLYFSIADLVVDAARGYRYVRKTSAPSPLARVRVSGMVEDLRVPESELDNNVIAPRAVDGRGNIYAVCGITGQSLRKIDGGSLHIVASASFADILDLATVSAYTLTGRIDFMLGPRVPVRPGADLLRRRPQGVLVRAERLHPPGRPVGGLCDFGACEAWFAAYPSIVLGNPTATTPGAGSRRGWSAVDVDRVDELARADQAKRGCGRRPWRARSRSRDSSCR